MRNMSFELLNNFFDKIFVVTLYRATERQLKIKKELSGLNYEFFYGIDKRDNTIEEVKDKNIYDEAASMHLARTGSKMTLGNICCSLSHCKIYESTINNNWQKVLIFEDDVVAVEENVLAIKNILSQLPATWELLYLGWAKNETSNFATRLNQTLYHIKYSIGMLKWNHKQINNIYPKPFSTNLRKAGFHDCTHAYAITLSAAKKLLQLQTPVVFNADDLLSHAITTELIEGYISVPKIFNQTSQYSNDVEYSFVDE